VKSWSGPTAAVGVVASVFFAGFAEGLRVGVEVRFGFDILGSLSLLPVRYRAPVGLSNRRNGSMRSALALSKSAHALPAGCRRSTDNDTPWASATCRARSRNALDRGSGT